MKDVFISYAREDTGFVDRLCTALRQHDVDIWVDLDGIYVGEDFWPQICSGIEESRCFCFVMSPHSAASKYCNDELKHAAGHSKRILPLVREESAGELPVLVARKQWLWFRESDGFDASLEKLLEALSRDLAHLDAHTSLLMRAREWNDMKQDASFLLRGRALVDGERWLVDASVKDPAPATEHTRYLGYGESLGASSGHSLLRLYWRYSPGSNAGLPSGVCTRL
jgi:hypothetical protein